ncbi:MAG TPA: ubiquitin-like domain-containing protein [Candidatus Saccharimonadales bacterium]|nr:ubiquitin-like domain-containing protein [Candidatus Saccharimonadales bacterium]
MRRKKRLFKEGITNRELHKHPFVIPVITFIVLSFLTMVGSVILGSQTIGASDSHVVQLSLDNKKEVIPTRATTVGDFLNRAKVTLHDGDIVEPAQDTAIDDNNFRINVYRARPVTIFDGDKRIQALSAATTARSIAAQVGVQVYPEDDLKQEVSNNVLRDQVLGDKITIDRATPANLNLYGTPVSVRTHAKTVKDLLKEKNVTLANGDTVQPSADTAITAGSQVFVTRVGTQIITTEEPIPMTVQTIEDPNLSFGASAIRQAGTPGKKLVTYQLDLQNGKEVARHVIQEVRTAEPVTQIVARGKAFDVDRDKSTVMQLAGINVANDYPYVDYIVSHESHWNPSARNPDGAYGLCQAYPGSKMATAGADWESNPVTQLKWCNGYALHTYGSWAAAYNHWLSARNW